MTAVTEKEITVSQLLTVAKKRVGFTVASLATHVDKEVYEMFMNVLKNINKEKGIQR